jgi:hypothetical protein
MNVSGFERQSSALVLSKASCLVGSEILLVRNSRKTDWGKPFGAPQDGTIFFPDVERAD